MDEWDGRSSVGGWGAEAGSNQGDSVIMAVRDPAGGGGNTQGVIVRSNGSDANSNLLSGGVALDTTYYIVATRAGSGAGNWYFSVSNGTTAETATVSDTWATPTLNQGIFGALETDGGEPGRPKIGYFAVYDEALSNNDADALRLGLENSGNWIPEPATMALLGLGGLMVLRRRRAA